MVSPEKKVDAPMRRFCFTLKVRKDRLMDYRDCHEAVWPEMLEALRESGWSNYTLFLRDDGLLVGYLETASLEDAVAAMKSRDVNARWQAKMAPFFEADEMADDAMHALEEVFHLD
jgi:L-rhamnose mutarotase